MAGPFLGCIISKDSKEKMGFSKMPKKPEGDQLPQVYIYEYQLIVI